MNKTNKNILLLDGGHKKTLAILRSLGQKRAYEITVAASNKRAISFFSKFADHKVVLPPPTQTEEFQKGLLSVLHDKSFITVIPTDYYSFLACSEIQDEINLKSHILLSSPFNLQFCGDKRKTNKLAQKLKIPCPETYDVEEIDILSESCNYILKSAKEGQKLDVVYVKGKKKVLEYIQQHQQNDLIIQEQIIGDGYGFFAFYKDGKCLSTFQHHRLREYPATGGYSVAAEGCFYEEIDLIGRRLLDELQWNGVAMVELKKNKADGRFYLMEINAKFWGSLDLTIASGVDFPQMWIDDALEKKLEEKNDYPLITFQWLLNGEFFHFIQRPKSFLSILKTLRKSKTDIWWSDLLPNLYQIVNIPMNYIKNRL